MVTGWHKADPSVAQRLSDEEAADLRLAFMRCAQWFPDLAGRIEAGALDDLWQDFAATRGPARVEPMDYLKYRFYEQDAAARSSYVTRAEYAALCRACNDADSMALLRDRGAFAQRFASLLGRRTLAPNPDNRDDLEQLLEQCSRVVVKPRRGGYGSGMAVVDVARCDRDALRAQLQTGEYLVEEYIFQDSALRSLHPASVNTVRTVLAVSADGAVRMVAAILRCGRGDAMNDNDWGLMAAVDVDTGIVNRPATTHFHEVFPAHPDTGVAFEGFRVPRWEELRRAARAAMRLFPGIRLVNWDWALTDDGRWIVVEGNPDGGFGPAQETLGKGLKREIEEAVGTTCAAALDREGDSEASAS